MSARLGIWCWHVSSWMLCFILLPLTWTIPKVPPNWLPASSSPLLLQPLKKSLPCLFLPLAFMVAAITSFYNISPSNNLMAGSFSSFYPWLACQLLRETVLANLIPLFFSPLFYFLHDTYQHLKLLYLFTF